MKLPRITIITPSFNQGEFIENTIRSVLDQNYANLEYMIFDGGSTDLSVDIIKKYEKHLAHWESTSDRGQTHAINKGIQKATGQIIAWLNSDDFYYAGTLDLIARAYLKFPNAGLYVGNGTLSDKSGKKIRTYSRGVGFELNALLRGSNYILQPSTFINCRAFKELGLLDESLRFTMDLEFWLRVSNKYPVVTLDKELAAYRWHNDIKTANGGLERWVEQWGVMRKYCGDQITPGLLVEFFQVLQERQVQEALHMPFTADFARQCHHTFYQAMQNILGTTDCIPVQGTDIRFMTNGTTARNDKRPETDAPNIVTSLGSKPKIDVVLPMGHSWFVRGAYVEALRHFGYCGNIFYVSEKQNRRALFEYLAKPRGDFMFLLNSDWHAQYLHNSVEWQKRWEQSATIRILFSFECMNNPIIKKNVRWWKDTLRALNQAMRSCNGMVFAHEIDEGLLRHYNVPLLWQPFAIDETVFPKPVNYQARKKRAFFRGKSTPFYFEETYRTRRRLMDFLKKQSYFDILDGYDYANFDESDNTTVARNRQFILEMNDYQIALILPSLSPTMVVRPFEAMASGCVAFQSQIAGDRSNRLFEHNKHLILFDENDPTGLVQQVHAILEDQDLGRQIARNGYEEVMAKHTTRHRITEIVEWLDQKPVWEGLKKGGQKQPLGHHSSRPMIGEITPIPKPETSGHVDTKRRQNAKILIDGVIFQLQQGMPLGISRVWATLLRALTQTSLRDRIVLLDREGTAPEIPGLRRRVIRAYDHTKFEPDSLYLQDICEQEKASLFVTTYYTFPENTHSLLMLHDMIPELRGQDLNRPEWRAKTRAIERATAYLAVSNSTKRDLIKLYPQHATNKIFVVHNAVSDEFRLNSRQEIENFRARHKIKRPYFMLSGNRLLYKNAILFFKAFSLMENKHDYEIFCTGGGPQLERMFLPYVRGIRCQVRFLTDRELSVAYSGALALIYPSQYEGFGLPILEAMKSGCPVITCRNSSIPEIAGDAVIYVDENDVADMQEALTQVQNKKVRNQLLQGGVENAHGFTWDKTSRQFVSVVNEIEKDIQDQPLHSDSPLQTVDRLIYKLQKQQGHFDLISSISQLKLMFTLAVPEDVRAIEKHEKIVARLPSDIFAELERGWSYGEENDAFISYFHGLALERRQSFEKALGTYLKAVKRADYDCMKFKWRFKYLAANVSRLLNRSDLAGHLLGSVLAEKPALVEAQKMLAEVSGRAPRDGGSGESVTVVDDESTVANFKAKERKFLI